jgi:hypothetical protein
VGGYEKPVVSQLESRGSPLLALGNTANLQLGELARLDQVNQDVPGVFLEDDEVPGVAE